MGDWIVVLKILYGLWSMARKGLNKMSIEEKNKWHEEKNKVYEALTKATTAEERRNAAKSIANLWRNI